MDDRLELIKDVKIVMIKQMSDITKQVRDIRTSMSMLIDQMSDLREAIHALLLHVNRLQSAKYVYDDDGKHVIIGDANDREDD